MTLLYIAKGKKKLTILKKFFKNQKSINVAPSQIADNLNLLYVAKGIESWGVLKIFLKINVAPLNKDVAPGKNLKD